MALHAVRFLIAEASDGSGPDWLSYAGGGLGGLFLGIVGALNVRRTTKNDAADKLRDDLMQRIDQQDKQLQHCEEAHRQTRHEFDELRREHHRALEQIDTQAGSIRRLEERVAQLQRPQGQP